MTLDERTLYDFVLPRQLPTRWCGSDAGQCLDLSSGTPIYSRSRRKLPELAL